MLRWAHLYSPLPEPCQQPVRIKRIHDAFRDAGLISKMKKLAIREAERDEVLLVHSETLWDKVMAIGGWQLLPIFVGLALTDHWCQT